MNLTIPRALTKLGYTNETVEAIVEHIAEHGHVIDAPGLKPEHYEVFDCAMGARSIKAMGHVRMMAAAQPFLSGAISKTVNLPETATVEEIEEVYLQGWKLGLKALAVYRDNCKVGQPLSDAKAKPAAETAPAATVEPVVEKVIEYRPVRKRLPKRRPSQTTSFAVGGAEGYLTAGSYPDDGLGEPVPEVRQAGFDPRRRHGRVLDRDLHRPAARGAAGDLRRQVHQHAVRAGRHDRRPRHPDGAVDHGLRLPPAGARPPRLRHPVVHGHLLGRGAHPSGRDRLVPAGRGRHRRRRGRARDHVAVDVDEAAHRQGGAAGRGRAARRVAEGRSERGRAVRCGCRIGSGDLGPAGALVGRACSSRCRATRPTPRCA
nr:hypothetical protein [Angustibacter aerolatus]